MIPANAAISSSDSGTAVLARFIGSQSILWIAAAVLLLVVPEAVISVVFGEPPGVPAIVVARLFGAELTALAIASAVTRDATRLVPGNGLFAAYLASNTLGFAVTIVAAARGVLRPAGMILVPLYLLYAVGFAIFWIRAPRAGDRG
jgi:hypothetical protein